MSEKTQKKSSAGFWNEAKWLLDRPVRARSGVNLSKLSKVTKEGQVVLVPDKVLGEGYLTHKITIAALAFSERAKKQINSAGGKVISVDELKKMHPQGDGVQLVV